jgi:predicted ABC-type ATPase
VATSNPKVRVIAGPNGSGKSTLLDLLSRLSLSEGFPLGFVLNPDELERELRIAGRVYLGTLGARFTDAELDAYIATHPLRDELVKPRPRVERGALVAATNAPAGYFTPMFCDFLREQWLRAGESFMFETVFSVDSKLALLRKARALGYRTYLYYICTEDVRINRERIQIRVQQGGHSVPDDKICARYDRSLELLPQMIKLADRSYHFDNSGPEHKLIAEFEGTKLMKPRRDLPAWFVRSVMEPMRLR